MPAGLASTSRFPAASQGAIQLAAGLTPRVGSIFTMMDLASLLGLHLAQMQILAANNGRLPL